MSRSLSALIRVQRKIYASLKAEVSRLMGPTPASIAGYERSYRRVFQKILARPSLNALTLSPDDFLAELRDCDFICVGDFHTDPQSQKTALRLLRKLQAVDPHSEWSIALELIPSHYQRWVDRFLSGQISQEHFLKAIRYREEWGFPWENYSPLFTWARQNGLPVLALNRPKALAAHMRGTDGDPTHDLHARDQWAAGVLIDRWLEPSSRRKRTLVLYGEMHVAPAHLPSAIRAVAKALGLGRGKNRALPQTASVFSNFDELYFKWAASGKDSSSEVLKVAPQTYCLMASTPWGKLQSAINWLEGGRASEAMLTDDSDELELDSSPTDDTGQFTEPLRWLCDFFDLPMPQLDTLQLVTIRNADQIEQSLRHAQLTRAEQSALRYHWLHNQRVYCAPLSLAYLGSPSANTYAEMAALHLLMNVRHRKRMLPEKDQGFYELILDSCFGFLGSLLLNPKRKCDLARDHQRRLRDLRLAGRNGVRPIFPEERAMRELTLKLLKRIDDPQGPSTYQTRNVASRMSAVLACRQVGKVLAKALYPAVSEGNVSPAQLKALFLERPGESGNPREICLWLAGRAANHPERTKTEHF